MMLVHALPNAVILEDNGYCLFLHAEEKGEPVLNAHFSPLNELDELDADQAEAVVACIGVFLHLKEMFAVLIREAQPASTSTWGAELVKEVIFYSIETGRRYSQTLTPSSSPSQTQVDMGNFAKFLSTSEFFFSASNMWDATLNLSDQASLVQDALKALQPASRGNATAFQSSPVSNTHAGVDTRHINSDPQFIWNLYLLSPLFRIMDALDPSLRHEFDKRSFAVPICQGYFGSRVVKHGNEMVLLKVISRRRWARAGPRFCKRGIDLYGNCSNAAETETILRYESNNKTMSFVQARASVPLLWKEKLSFQGGPDVTIHEPLDDSVEPLKLHFHALLDKYSGPVHILNLMRDKNGTAEATLGSAFGEVLQMAKAQDQSLVRGTVYHKFDVHTVAGGQDAVPKTLYYTQHSVLDDMGYTEVCMDWQGEVRELTKKQIGVYRVNYCLDRTTLGGFVLSEATIGKFVKGQNEWVSFAGSALQQAHRDLFAENGDVLSDIYVGSPAMTSTFIRSGHATHKDVLVQLQANRSRVKQALFWDLYKQDETTELTGQQNEGSD
ncbi:Inositol-1,4,5-trisphosphate 5-phosphatase 1 [Microbotryomycetes sp. JL201]|nr:Inositol-1,4,5-trisphosphate 5-phosphatase 1 [Microbotryomycetes sp. JL201]